MNTVEIDDEDIEAALDMTFENQKVDDALIARWRSHLDLDAIRAAAAGVNDFEEERESACNFTWVISCA